MYAPVPTFLAPADTARAVGDVYSVSLLATLPVLLALFVFLCLRHSSAGTRTVVWRSALAGLLVIYAGRFMPWQWMAWVLPELLSRPLVALGTVRLDVAPEIANAGEPLPADALALRTMLFLYWSGVAFVLLRTVIARFRLATIKREAVVLESRNWRMQLTQAGKATGTTIGSVRLLTSPRVQVPLTWGVWRPVVLLPSEVHRWPADRVQAVLRHELAHVRSRDAAMRLAARVACALFWFHPGVWWLARSFENDAEGACDDRVLLSGVRASDYAEWLAASSRSPAHDLGTAMALARRGNLRARLADVTNVHRRLTMPGRRAVLCTVTATMAIVAPLATARLAPTRGVLTSLMQEPRWESRAWAVVRLAQRPDSVDVARAAARHDPDPAVRAWARYALARGPVRATPLPRS